MAKRIRDLWSPLEQFVSLLVAVLRGSYELPKALLRFVCQLRAALGDPEMAAGRTAIGGII